MTTPKKPSTSTARIPVEAAAAAAAAAEAVAEKTKSSSATAQPKKRKRVSKKKKETSPVTKSSSQQARTATLLPPPSAILVIDNGGDTLKYGWVEDDRATTPLSLPNLTGRLRHQITVLAGDEIERVQPNQLESTCRSTERGFVTNLGNQIQVWKRLLDNLRVGISSSSSSAGAGAVTNKANNKIMNSEAARAFGWKVASSRAAASPPPYLVQSRDMAVLLLLPPHCPRLLLEQMAQVWFEDFGVSHVGFALSAVMAGAAAASNKSKESCGGCCCCVVDAGWSATHIVPTYKTTKVLTDGVRRMNLGGRHLINLWKYHVSYRQWNLMDQEWILRDVHHRLSFLSTDFHKQMRLARRLPLGKRPWDRDYVLPDMQTTTQGQIRLPVPLQKMMQEEEEKNVTTEQTTTPSNAAAVEGNEDAAEVDDKNDQGDNAASQDDDQEDEGDDDDSDQETEQQIRRRVMRQREEEERRRRELELEQQILQLSVERFAIPEVLFRPSDAGLPRDMAGLPRAIVQGIDACPAKFRAALYGNVFVTGGLAQIPNFQSRLQDELRSLAPSQYQVRVTVSDEPINQAWLGARDWVRETPSHSQWSISREEWEESKKDPKKSKPWHRLLVANGGVLL